MRIRVWALGVLAAAAVPVLGATAASASLPPSPQPHPLTALTWMINRDDGGGVGYWAKDYFARDLTITPEGPATLTNCGAHATSCYAFTASLKDKGAFHTIPGAYTPNQGGADAGKHIRQPVAGQMNGYGDFTTFYATAQPDMRLVPHVNAGDTNPSYLWPELAFPAGTVNEASLNEDPWGYFYSARVLVLAPPNPFHLRYVVQHQQWADTSVNDGGQDATAGNITG